MKTRYTILPSCNVPNSKLETVFDAVNVQIQKLVFQSRETFANRLALMLTFRHYELTPFKLCGVINCLFAFERCTPYRCYSQPVFFQMMNVREGRRVLRAVNYQNRANWGQQKRRAGTKITTIHYNCGTGQMLNQFCYL